MLKDLDKIDWKNLKHAYGSAEDVPEDIRNLASLDEKIRDKALYNLYGNIFHQGTRYEATPHAIPFIYELIENKDVKDRHKLILLLVSLALGYEEKYLIGGVDVEKLKAELLECESILTDKIRADNKKYGYSFLSLIDCYDNVKDGIPKLLQLLNSAHINIRTHVLYAISWFPELANTLIPKIIHQLEYLEDEKEIANAILTIGVLVKQSKKEIDLSTIKAYFYSNSQLIRTCAAIALAKDPIKKNILTILIESIKLGKEFNYVEGILFNEGRVSGYASKVLSKYGSSEKEKIVPVLCKSLKTVNFYQSLDITYAIMSIINYKKTKRIKNEELSDLTPLEVKVLDSIYHYGGWETQGRGAIFLNYSELLRSVGVPDSKEKLGIYLNKK